MTAQNAELIQRGYDAFARADLPAVFEVLDSGITWHVPGSSPLSGDYRGHGEVSRAPATRLRPAFRVRSSETTGAGRSRPAPYTPADHQLIADYAEPFTNKNGYPVDPDAVL